MTAIHLTLGGGSMSVKKTSHLCVELICCDFTSHHTTSHVFEPIYIPQTLNIGTCLRQADLFYSAGLHRNRVLATANTEEIGRGFGKNAGEWTGRVEISKEETPGSKRSMYGYIQTYSRL